MSYQQPQTDDVTLSPVIFYDGVCKLCNRSVTIILRIDRQGRLKMAALQSDYGRRVLAEHGMEFDPLDTLMLLERERLSTKSTAIIRISKYLGGVWPLAMILLIIPRFIRDFFYDIIAKNRYRWFGKYNTCPLPDPEFSGRFYT